MSEVLGRSTNTRSSVETGEFQGVTPSVATQRANAIVLHVRQSVIASTLPRPDGDKNKTESHYSQYFEDMKNKICYRLSIILNSDYERIKSYLSTLDSKTKEDFSKIMSKPKSKKGWFVKNITEENKEEVVYLCERFFEIIDLVKPTLYTNTETYFILSQGFANESAETSQTERIKDLYSSRLEKICEDLPISMNSKTRRNYINSLINNPNPEKLTKTEWVYAKFEELCRKLTTEDSPIPDNVRNDLLAWVRNLAKEIGPSLEDHDRDLVEITDENTVIKSIPLQLTWGIGVGFMPLLAYIKTIKAFTDLGTLNFKELNENNRENKERQKAKWQQICETANQIAQKIKIESVTQSLTDEEKSILTSDNLVELENIISNSDIKNESGFRLLQLAAARIRLLHVSVLLTSGYSYQKAQKATEALFRRFDLRPDIFKSTERDTENKEEPNYEIKIPNIEERLRVFIADAKTSLSSGRKLLKQIPEGFALDVIKDSCRMTITIPDESWNNEEDIMVIMTKVLPYFMQLLGTDIYRSRIKFNLKGSGTNRFSTQKRQSIQITNVFKYYKLDQNKAEKENGIGQTNFEIQFVPESQFKPSDPEMRTIYESERQEYESKQSEYIYKVLGFKSDLQSYLIGLAEKAIRLDSYFEEPLSVETMLRILNINKRVAEESGNPMEDPLGFSYAQIVSILANMDLNFSQKMIKYLRDKPYMSNLFNELLRNLKDMNKLEDSKNDKLTKSIQNLQFILAPQPIPANS